MNLFSKFLINFNIGRVSIPFITSFDERRVFSNVFKGIYGRVPRKYYQLTEQGETQFHLLVTEWRDFAKGVQEIIEGGMG